MRDKQGRTPLFHAVLSENLALLEKLLDATPSPSLAVVDKQWGWTPLHYAASIGNTELASLLLQYKASPYTRSKVLGVLPGGPPGYTPLEIAEANACAPVVDLLNAHILSEPAQCVLPPGNDRGAVWLGAKEAAFPMWFTDRGFDAVLSIFDNMEKHPKLRWLDELLEPPKEDEDAAAKGRRGAVQLEGPPQVDDGAAPPPRAVTFQGDDEAGSIDSAADAESVASKLRSSRDGKDGPAVWRCVERARARARVRFRRSE